MTVRIGIIEDEPAIRDMLQFTLETAGYEVVSSGSIAEAKIKMLEHTLPDLLLLDWMLPDMSGVDFLRQFRAKSDTQQVPVIIVTALGEERHKVEGLEAGADDYILKPFSPKELLARISAILRRVSPQTLKKGDCAKYVFGVLQLDAISHRITLNNKPLHVGPTEYRLLLHFVKNPERVYTRTQLLDAVWGTQVIVEERTVDVHIRRLRKLLAVSDIDEWIQTVRGAGYRFSPDIQE